LDIKGLRDLRPKLRGKARVLIQNDTQRKTMDIEDSLFEFIKDFLRGGCIFERDEMGVGGKSLHNDHDSCVSIGFAEGASEVYGQGLIGFVRCREREGFA